jgi:hypothetical protein
MRRFIAAAAVAACVLVLGVGAAGAAPTSDVASCSAQVSATGDLSDHDRDW